MFRIILPRNFWSGLGFGLALTLALAVVVWAGYTGPNRSTTQQVRDPDSEAWYCTKASARCDFTPGVNPCPPYGSHPSAIMVERICGWTNGYSCGCDPQFTENTINLPPATVGGSAACSSPGGGGWCRGGASVNFSASEPLSGEVIELIEGNPVGVLCDPSDGSNVSCSWSGGDGSFNLQFWAVSSYGDTSGMASTDWRLDSSPPSFSLALSGGTPGGGGWYRGGTVRASASGSDALSGIAGGEISIDGGPWAGSGQVNRDGVHTASGRVRDVAGNEATGSATIRYDSTAPSLSAGLNGTAGREGWYLSPVTASAAATDSLSGVAEQQVNADGSGWRSGSVVISQDGVHNLSFRAVDVAGNEAVIGGLTIRIDTHPPESVFVVPPNGSETWVSGTVELVGQSLDLGSGLRSVEISYDNGRSWAPLQVNRSEWSDRWETRSVPNGTYVVLARAGDVAGHLESTARVTLHVDNLAPLVDIPDFWLVDESAPLVVEEQGNGLGGAQVLIQDGELNLFAFQYDPAQIPSSIRWDGILPNGINAAPGDYGVLASAWDLAGNRGQDAGVIHIPAPNPIAQIFQSPADAEPAAAPELSAIELPAAEVIVAEPPAAAEPEAPGLWLWPAIAWLGLLAGLGFSKVVDPRPAALGRLLRELDEVRRWQQE